MWNWIEFKYLRVFLVLWSLAATGAAIMHLFTAQYLVSLTAWQYAHNWQMEIAFFDLAWTGFIFYALRTANHSLQKQIAIVLGPLSIPLGTNHLSGYLIDGKMLHLIFAVLNYLCVLSSLLIMISSKKLISAD